MCQTVATFTNMHCLLCSLDSFAPARAAASHAWREPTPATLKCAQQRVRAYSGQMYGIAAVFVQTTIKPFIMLPAEPAHPALFFHVCKGFCFPLHCPQSQPILPNGMPWRQHLYLMLVSAKLLADTEAMLQVICCMLEMVRGSACLVLPCLGLFRLVLACFGLFWLVESTCLMLVSAKLLADTKAMLQGILQTCVDWRLGSAWYFALRRPCWLSDCWLAGSNATFTRLHFTKTPIPLNGPTTCVRSICCRWLVATTRQNRHRGSSCSKWRRR